METAIDREVLRRMRDTLDIRIRAGKTVAEASAEARGRGYGAHPGLPPSVIDDAVKAMLIEMGALEPEPSEILIGNRHYTEAPDELVAGAIAYALCFDERGKVTKSGRDFMAALVGRELVQRLKMSNFRIVLGPPAKSSGG